jgi:hypothetical protein
MSKRGFQGINKQGTYMRKNSGDVVQFLGMEC